MCCNHCEQKIWLEQQRCEHQLDENGSPSWWKSSANLPLGLRPPTTLCSGIITSKVTAQIWRESRSTFKSSSCHWCCILSLYSRTNFQFNEHKAGLRTWGSMPSLSWHLPVVILSPNVLRKHSDKARRERKSFLVECPAQPSSERERVRK